MKDNIVLTIIVIGGVLAALIWIGLGRVFTELGAITSGICCYLVAAVAMIVAAISFLGKRK